MSTPTISPELLKEAASTNFGQYYTSMLQSSTIRTVLGLVVTFVAAKLFKVEASDTQVQDWVELVLVLGLSAIIAWTRYRSTRQIMPAGQAVEQMLPAMLEAATPQVRADLLKLVDQRNPELGNLLRRALLAKTVLK